MRALIWLLRLVLFLVLLGLAAKNVEPVSLRFYFAREWQVSLALLIFLSFSTGTLAGMLGMLAIRRRAKAAAEQAQSAVIRP